MAIVLGIKFRTGQKIYYFDPKGIEFTDKDYVVVETARGMEFGKVAMANKDVSDEEIVAPLKPIVRKATQHDHTQNEKNLNDRDFLINEATEKVQSHKLNMKIVDAEYTFDRSKVIIYFTAESRVDFRELVKDLASVFRLRIELRQIYEREDIKLRGALASCGRPCCCITHLQDYDKVSIKMAKLQGLSLSPQKISGCCGKLMCCLRYENHYYQDMYRKMPKIGSYATTKDGKGTVLSHDVLRQTVKMRIELYDGSYDERVYPLDQINANSTQNDNDIDE